MPPTAFPRISSLARSPRHLLLQLCTSPLRWPPSVTQGTAATHAAERASDMWSVGVLAFEVLTGRQLFDAESYADEDVVETLLG